MKLNSLANFVTAFGWALYSTHIASAAALATQLCHQNDTLTREYGVLKRVYCDDKTCKAQGIWLQPNEKRVLFFGQRGGYLFSKLTAELERHPDLSEFLFLFGATFGFHEIDRLNRVFSYIPVIGSEISFSHLKFPFTTAVIRDLRFIRAVATLRVVRVIDETMQALRNSDIQNTVFVLLVRMLQVDMNQLNFYCRHFSENQCAGLLEGKIVDSSLLNTVVFLARPDKLGECPQANEEATHETEKVPVVVRMCTDDDTVDTVFRNVFEFLLMRLNVTLRMTAAQSLIRDKLDKMRLHSWRNNKCSSTHMVDSVFRVSGSPPDENEISRECDQLTAFFASLAGLEGLNMDRSIVYVSTVLKSERYLLRGFYKKQNRRNTLLPPEEAEECGDVLLSPRADAADNQTTMPDLTQLKAEGRFVCSQPNGFVPVLYEYAANLTTSRKRELRVRLASAGADQPDYMFHMPPYLQMSVMLLFLFLTCLGIGFGYCVARAVHNDRAMSRSERACFIKAMSVDNDYEIFKDEPTGVPSDDMPTEPPGSGGEYVAAKDVVYFEKSASSDCVFHENPFYEQRRFSLPTQRPAEELRTSVDSNSSLVQVHASSDGDSYVELARQATALKKVYFDDNVEVIELKPLYIQQKQRQQKNPTRKSEAAKNNTSELARLDGNCFNLKG